MKPLMAVILAGHSKDYAVPKFLEMCEAWVDFDVMFAVDEPRLDIGMHQQLQVPQLAGLTWCSHICHLGRMALNNYAMERDYTNVIWQGVDCYYAYKFDISDLLWRSEFKDIVGGLVAGRNKPDYPVCRKYKFKDGLYTEETEELDPDVLQSNLPIPVTGYIGSDALVVSRHAIEVMHLDGYTHWHERSEHDRSRGAFCSDEYFMKSALEEGIVPVVDTGVRPWHAHETGRTVRYPGEVIDINELTFK